MYYRKIITIVSVLAIASFVLLPAISLAGTAPDPGSLLQGTGREAGFDVSDSETQLTRFIGQIINVILSVLGVIFFVLLVYGGFLWMTSAGNEDKVKKAKTLITDAIIGLIIILAAYAISAFVINSLVSATIE